MSNRCVPHGNLILSASEPWPAGNSDYCHACWRESGGGGVARATKETTTCRHLSPERKRIGLRMWQECTGGHGSKTTDGRKGHCTTCGTKTAGVWRVGKECGPGCPGFNGGDQ